MKTYIVGGFDTGATSAHVMWSAPMRYYDWTWAFSLFDPVHWTGGYYGHWRWMEEGKRAVVPDLWLGMVGSSMDHPRFIPHFEEMFGAVRDRGGVVGIHMGGSPEHCISQATPEQRALWSTADFAHTLVSDRSVNSRVAGQLGGIPVCDVPLPCTMSSVAAELESALRLRDSAEFMDSLPPDIRNRWLTTKPVHADNPTTAMAAEAGIPMHITADHSEGLLERHGAHTYAPREYSPSEWMAALSLAKGVLYTTPHPTCGRGTLYATAMQKPSLTNRTGLQDLLYPGINLPGEGCDPPALIERISLAEARAPQAHGELPARCEPREVWADFATFLLEEVGFDYEC